MKCNLNEIAENLKHKKVDKISTFYAFFVV